MPRLLLLATVLSLAASAAQADPGYYVVVPYDNEGLRTVEFRYWAVRDDRDGHYVWPEIGIGYGVTSRWTTTLFMSYVGSAEMPIRQSSLNWQNEVLLTQGEWPVDVGLHLQLISDRNRSDGYTLEFGPVLQTDIGRTQLNANLIFERNRGAGTPGATQLKYQWQVRYRWIEQLHFGAQGFGEVGTWDDWSSRALQSHRAGPALFTTFRLSEREVFKVQAAYLVGRTYGEPGSMFTLRANIDF